MSQLNSDVKQFALEVLDGFDKLARPEIGNSLFEWIWNTISNRALNIILKKPDEELRKKLGEINKVFAKYNNLMTMSVQIHEGEALGAIKIPEVGELAMVKQLTPSMEAKTKKTLELVEDLLK